MTAPAVFLFLIKPNHLKPSCWPETLDRRPPPHKKWQSPAQTIQEQPPVTPDNPGDGCLWRKRSPCIVTSHGTGAKSVANPRASLEADERFFRNRRARKAERLDVLGHCDKRTKES